MNRNLSFIGKTYIIIFSSIFIMSLRVLKEERYTLTKKIVKINCRINIVKECALYLSSS